MAFRLEVPGTVEEAVRSLSGAAPGTVAVLAGGTDLLLDIGLGRATPARVISLRKLPWRSVERRAGRLEIGSLAPLHLLEVDPALPRDLPGLYEAVRAVGSVALRSRATLGGNVVRSSSASDLLPMLLALGAEIGLVGPSGRRTLPIHEFLDRPRRPAMAAEELVERIVLPERAPSSFRWQRVRPANDVSQVSVAVARTAAGWRVALGGIAPVPALVPEAAALLGEKEPGPAAIHDAAVAAGTAARFVSDQRATEAYRRLVVRVLTERALTRALGRPPAPEGGP